MNYQYMVCGLGVVGVILASLLWAPASVRAAARESAIERQVIVWFKKDVTAAERDRIRDRVGVDPLERGTPIDGFELTRPRDGVDPDAAVRKLENYPEVVLAERNGISEPSATTPDDPEFKNQWSAYNTRQALFEPDSTTEFLAAGGIFGADMKLREAWDKTTGNSDVIVAVIDTGVSYRHPDLKDNMWSNPGETKSSDGSSSRSSDRKDNDSNGFVDDVHGVDFVDDDSDPNDSLGHGTGVAGVVAARGNNGVGLSGAAQQASIMAVRIRNAEGTDFDAARGVVYAVKNKARIVNISFNSSHIIKSLKEAIDNSPDTLFINSAGNEGRDLDSGRVPIYPCSFSAANLICVASTTNRDEIANHSNYGATSVDLAAPGENIFTTKTLATKHEASAPIVPNRQEGWSASNGSLGVAHVPDGAVAVLSPTFAGFVDLTLNDLDHLSDRDHPQVIKPGGFCNGALHILGPVRVKITVQLRKGKDEWVVIGQKTLKTRYASRAGDIPFSFRGPPASQKAMLRFDVQILGGVDRSMTIDFVKVRCLNEAYSAKTSYGYGGGTSFAAPAVAGVAALLLAKNSKASVEQLRTALLDGGDLLPISSDRQKIQSGRRINAEKALQRIGSRR